MNFPTKAFQGLATPFYYYDTAVLHDTLRSLNSQIAGENYHVHYAIKANANPKLLQIIKQYGLGIDCVSGGEIKAALQVGFDPKKIVFAGVGKADWEIEAAMDAGILCLNVESIPELEVIEEIAGKKGKIVDVCLRINPNVGAHTHANITTGLSENKFGIDMAHMFQVTEQMKTMEHVHLLGLHFHIGSQILEMDDFKALCDRVNELQEQFAERGIDLKVINVGGGLGIDYNDPQNYPLPDFKAYFDTFRQHLKLRDGQELHFELGRAIVGQCGNLITKVLYVKDNTDKKFAIVDAGFTELIRPALYGAHHAIINLTSEATEDDTYDVVGPICESSDVFDTNVRLRKTQRGDLIALLSAGAYGEAMASCYNCRPLPATYTSDEL